MQLPALEPLSPLTSTDTICAVSTPAGRGGIAVIRVSGPSAIQIVSKIWHGRDLESCANHTVHLGTIKDSLGNELDQAVVTLYRCPKSFTGEDVVEISVHGSRYIQQEALASLIKAGARLAEAGEFTRRAFKARRLDLAQAEAVADLIASESRSAHRIAINQMRGRYSDRLRELREQLMNLASLLELELDFSEEDVEFASRAQLLETAKAVRLEVNRLADSFRAGQAIKEGIPVAIVGATNAGKSSLLNALLGDERAIVSDIHGTTRDTVEDTLTLGDYTYRLIDTAGLRNTDDEIEGLGIQRSLQAAQKAQILIIVIDGNDPKAPTLPDVSAETIVVVNKSDLPASTALQKTIAELRATISETIYTCAKSGGGIDRLTDALQLIAKKTESGQDSILVTNLRHYESLKAAQASIERVIEGLSAQLSGDLIALDLRDTIDHLSTIIGDITSADILQSIFSRFCIGK